jgi:hypothetical protein
MAGTPLASGGLTATFVDNNAVLSGSIGSGQIASGHLASGLLANITGGTTSGIFLSYPASQLISGGRCVSFSATFSGTVQIATPYTASGLPCIGVVYANTLSGQMANIMVQGVGPDVPAVEGSLSMNPGLTAAYVGTSGLLANQPGSGSVLAKIGVFISTSGAAILNVAAINSGDIGVFRLNSGAVISGNIGSGQIAGFGKSGLANARMVASGSIGGFDMADLSVNSGVIGVQAIARQHLFAGGVSPGFDAALAWGAGVGPNNLFAGQGQMSGGAVAFSSNASGFLTVVPAERGSGLRLPCIGVMASGAVSGGSCMVVTQGFVPAAHFIASGFINQTLYVGSGGFIVTQSGGLGGVFSGAGPGQAASSGGGVQRIGVCVSGGMLVQIDLAITSGLVSTPVGTF